MKYFTYVLFSHKFEQLQIGHTYNLENRFSQHNKGRVASTKPFIPYEIIYFEVFENKDDAVKREKELKSSTGRRFLKQFIK